MFTSCVGTSGFSDNGKKVCTGSGNKTFFTVFSGNCPARKTKQMHKDSLKGALPLSS